MISSFIGVVFLGVFLHNLVEAQTEAESFCFTLFTPSECFNSGNNSNCLWISIENGDEDQCGFCTVPPLASICNMSSFSNGTIACSEEDDILYTDNCFLESLHDNEEHGELYECLLDSEINGVNCSDAFFTCIFDQECSTLANLTVFDGFIMPAALEAAVMDTCGENLNNSICSEAFLNFYYCFDTCIYEQCPFNNDSCLENFDSCYEDTNCKNAMDFISTISDTYGDDASNDNIFMSDITIEYCNTNNCTDAFWSAWGCYWDLCNDNETSWCLTNECSNHYDNCKNSTGDCWGIFLNVLEYANSLDDNNDDIIENSRRILQGNNVDDDDDNEIPIIRTNVSSPSPSSLPLVYYVQALCLNEYTCDEDFINLYVCMTKDCDDDNDDDDCCLNEQLTCLWDANCHIAYEYAISLNTTESETRNIMNVWCNLDNNTNYCNDDFWALYDCYDYCYNSTEESSTTIMPTDVSTTEESVTEMSTTQESEPGVSTTQGSEPSLTTTTSPSFPTNSTSSSYSEITYTGASCAYIRASFNVTGADCANFNNATEWKDLIDDEWGSDLGYSVTSSCSNNNGYVVITGYYGVNADYNEAATFFSSTSSWSDDLEKSCSCTITNIKTSHKITCDAESSAQFSSINILSLIILLFLGITLY